MIRFFLKQLLLLLCRKSYKSFYKTLESPQQAQEKLLISIISNMKNTRFGLRTGELKSVKEFTSSVPLSKFEDYEELIEKISSGDGKVLTREDVLFFEPTSGSSGIKKHIPYNKSLKSSFKVMFEVWVYDVLKNIKTIKFGKFFFSISPQFRERADSGIALGLDSDAEYISGPLGLLFSFFSLIPSKIKFVREPEKFLHIVSLYLMTQKNLEIISIWNPSYLLSFINYISNNSESLVEDAKSGHYLHNGIQFKFPTITDERIITIKNKNWAKLFKSVEFVSSWGASNSKTSFRKLHEVFPNAYIQEKGLLATEAPLTIPLIEEKTFLPLLSEVFYEFKNTITKELHLIHELEIGVEYELIITTKGGLYRYQLMDIVKVQSFVGKTPAFEFQGRGGAVSDLVGEKLTECFVRENIQLDQFFSIIPDLESSTYYIVSNTPVDLSQVEKNLCLNLHYDIAIKLQQLSPLKELIHENMEAHIIDYFKNVKGMSEGDIKHQSLLHKENDGKLLNYLRNPKSK